MANPLGKAKEGRNKPDYTNKHKTSISTLIDRVVNEADIVLEILDSRFIEKTRNIEIERKVKSSGKILIYIFNAISVYLTSRSLFISVLTPLLVNFFPILATVYFWKLRKWFT